MTAASAHPGRAFRNLALVALSLGCGLIVGPRPAQAQATPQSIEGSYVGSFSCTAAGPNPAFNAPIAAEIIGDRFEMKRRNRIGPEVFSGRVERDGSITIIGAGQSETTGIADWGYELKGALVNGRLEAQGRMHNRREVTLRTCTLSLGRPNGGGRAAQGRQNQDDVQVAQAAEKAAQERKAQEERKVPEARGRAAPVPALQAAPQVRAPSAPQAADLVFDKPGAEQRVALVIGNSAYRHTARLDNPQIDARAMAAALTSAKFELIGGGAQLDLDKAQLERAIYDFTRRLRQGTVGMFYYAGHGFEVSGRNYLAPIDANPTSTRDIDFMLVDIDLLLRQLRDADNRLNMVVLDACRNNPFGGAGVRGGGGLAEIKSRPSGTIISFATAAGEVARDGPPGQNSPYTAALVAAIKKPGLGVLDTFNDVAISVLQATNKAQQPWIQSTGIQGQFYFMPAAAQGSSTAKPAAADLDAMFWSSVKDSRDPAQLSAYLAKFPDGAFAPIARIWLDDAKRGAQAKP